jgi:TRAP transporter 4TM/12TM fusion protein
MERRLNAALAAVALSAAVYHILFAIYRPWTDTKHAIAHVGLAVVIVALAQAQKAGPIGRAVGLAVLVVGLAASVYLFGQADDLEIRYGIGLTRPQMIAAFGIIATVFILAWKDWGASLTLLGLAALVYFFFGHYLPGPLRASPQPSFDFAMTFLMSGGGSGIYGQLTPVSANVIFYFMLFGALLESTGVMALFIEVGNWIGRLLKGGAAIMTVIASSLLGTITGATVANVAVMGNFTIPAMKGQGFRPETAGAIESVSSLGGQILPPVMGVGAFVMASLLGVPYITVAAMAVLPALLYYASILIVIMCLVRQLGLVAGAEDKIDLRVIRGQVLPFVLPLAVLVYYLVQGYSEQSAVLAAMLALVVTTFSRLRVVTSFAGLTEAVNQIVAGLISGARQGAALAIVIAIVSLISQSLITTALGPKLAAAIAAFVGSKIWLGLVLVMLTALVLGCGLPTVVDYTMIAIMVIPSLTKLGLEPASAHMFAYYFAVYAAVTPPVATAALLASRMAGAGYWATGWASCKLLLAPSVVPFLFVYHPSVLVFPPEPSAVFLPLAAWGIAAVALAGVSVGFLIVQLTRLDVVACLAAVALVLVWIFNDGAHWLLFAAAALGGVVLRQRIAAKAAS